jgi:RNA polymerase sigma factor (sigma-70 family)
VAARWLVERYEQAIRRHIRFLLMDNRLRRVLEEADVCQSVLGQLFAGLREGCFELNEPEQLVGLLRQLVRNKITDQARYWKARRRDYLRNITRIDPDNSIQLTSPEPTPSRIVAGVELLAEFEGRLSDEERTVFHLRRQGLSWSDIAGRIGGRPEAIRKRFERALKRVGRTLDLGA